MGWNHQLDKHWRYSYFWLGGVVLMGRWFDMSTYFHVKDPRSKCWWQLRASMCLDTSNMFGTSAILISLNLLRWEFSNFGWISTLMKLKKRAAEEVMMIREWPASYLKNIWKLGVFSAYLDLFSWWFFMDWDHMGFITIKAYHLGEYFWNFFQASSQGTIGCTPNSVPTVSIVFSDGILGDNLPINTHKL